jgi:ribose/xylose/arabinose/galactoside ABC-type transport system permease subunit
MVAKMQFKVTTVVTVLLAYVLLFVLFSVIAPYFLTLRNIMNMLLYSSVIGITVTGMTMILLSGGLDISVGAVIGLSGMVAGIAVKYGVPVPAAILLSLVTGALCGTVNGLLITKLHINPLITTLATMSIFRGIALLTTNGLSQIISNQDFKWLGRHYLVGIVPVCVIITLILFLVVGYVLKYTPFGRKLYSVGGNPEASRLAGINVNRVRWIAYMTCGLMAGLSGVLTASQTGAALPVAGMGAEMDVIGAVILGGVSLAGGKGKIAGAFLGVLILATLSNGLTLLNVMSFWQTIAKGLVLLFAVALDVARGGGYK